MLFEACVAPCNPSSLSVKGFTKAEGTLALLSLPTCFIFITACCRLDHSWATPGAGTVATLRRCTGVYAEQGQ